MSNTFVAIVVVLPLLCITLFAAEEAFQEARRDLSLNAAGKAVWNGGAACVLASILPTLIGDGCDVQRPLFDAGLGLALFGAIIMRAGASARPTLWIQLACAGAAATLTIWTIAAL